LVVRYLAAFGPASTADVQTWSGLSRLGEVIERVDLIRVKSEGGQTLYDIPDAPRPDPDTPAPVRLVAPFDNILLSHADRTRIMSDEHRRRLFSSKNGIVPGALLVDGYVAGWWELVGKGEATSILVHPYIEPDSDALDAIAAKGGRLLNRAFETIDPVVTITA
jgi:hypothetical protein